MVLQYDHCQMNQLNAMNNADDSNINFLKPRPRGYIISTYIRFLFSETSPESEIRMASKKGLWNALELAEAVEDFSARGGATIAKVNILFWHVLQ